MSKRLPKKARSALVKVDLITNSVTFQLRPSGDYDADNEANVKVAKERLGEIAQLMGQPHSSSGLTNKTAALLSSERKRLETFIRQYERKS